jgi:cysteine-rich repeat protein
MCNAPCNVAIGQYCSAFVCVQGAGVCGDNTVNTDQGEECDDGNAVGGDGCSAFCLNETCAPVDATCSVNADCCSGSCVGNICQQAAGACGDGILDVGESCDDGNTTGGDGCSATCQVEPGYTCPGSGTCMRSCGGCPEPTQQTTQTAPDGAYRVVPLGDMDGDGNTDFAVLGDQYVSLASIDGALGITFGTNSWPVLSTDTTPAVMAYAVDVDGVEPLDLLLLNGACFGVLLGTSAPGFALPVDQGNAAGFGPGASTDISAPDSPCTLSAAGGTLGAAAFGDFNLDGTLDVAILDESGGQVDFYRASPTLGFESQAAQMPSLSVASPSGVASADLDGDGARETLVLTSTDFDQAPWGYVLVGNAWSPAWQLGSPSVTGPGPFGAIAVDLTFDGRDEVVFHGGDAMLRVWSPDGTGGFSELAGGGAGGSAGILRTGDIDGDGVPDLLHPVFGDSALAGSRFYGVDNGYEGTTFAELYTAIYDVAILDLNGDGIEEIVVADGQGRLVVFSP